MSRSYKQYYAAVTVHVQGGNNSNSLLGVNALTKGIIYFGLRFQDTLLDLGDLYKKLGFRTIEEITRVPESQERPPSSFLLSTQSDGIRLGFFRTYEVTLVPKKKGDTLEPYGDRYVTQLPASGVFDDRKAANIMYNFTFDFKSGEKTYPYQVLSGSIKPIRGKKLSGKIFFS